MTVSILSSVYNEPESQIRESIESILNQSFRDFELIVINDNPLRDDVKGILDSYADSRIVFYQNPHNVGLAMSMNKAAELAHSNCFARMDADDIAEPLRLEKEIEYIKRGYDVVFSGYAYIDENSNKIESKNAPIYSNDKLNYNVSLDPSIIHHPTTLFTRKIFEEVCGYRNFPCSQDADLWMRMAEVGARFYYIPEILLQYRINSQSVSNKRWYKQQLTCNYIFDLSIERLAKGKDTFSIENYYQYLRQWGVDNPVAESKLRDCYRLLSNSNSLAEKGKRIASLILRIKVFISSSLMRNHYIALKRKEYILRSMN